MKKTDEEIELYTEIIKAIADDMESQPEKWRHAVWSDDFIQCVIHLLDKSVGDLETQNICLDILDSLFRCGLNSIKPISDLIDTFGV